MTEHEALRFGDEVVFPESDVFSPDLEIIAESSAPEEDPRWRPILQALGAQIAADFIWAATTDTIQTYEHRETSRYIHIDGVTGEFLNQQCEVISLESALEHARQPATTRITKAPEPETVVEVVAQQVHEPFTTTEPELNAFTRKHELDAALPFWGVVATDAEAHQPGVSNSVRLVAGIKRKLLTKANGWGVHRFSSSQGNSLRSSSGTDTQEPNFAMFTRRTPVL